MTDAMDTLSKDLAAALAERFGLIMAEATDGRSLSLLFVGAKANETTFREVLASLLMDHNVTHQFAPRDGLPGVYARGLTPPDSYKPIYLVVVGDENAARYVPLPPTTR